MIEIVTFRIGIVPTDWNSSSSSNSITGIVRSTWSLGLGLTCSNIVGRINANSGISIVLIHWNSSKLRLTNVTLSAVIKLVVVLLMSLMEGLTIVLQFSDLFGA